MVSTALAGGMSFGKNISRKSIELDSLKDNCSFSGLPPNYTYLNSGTEGTMPECVLSTLQENLIKWARNPTNSYELDPILGKRQEFNRNKVADFLNVGLNNICLTDNTTMGLSMTIMGLAFGPNDKVVTTNQEHTAIRSPLQLLNQRQGLKIETRSFPSANRLSKMKATEIVDFLFPNIPALRNAKALCVSHVYPTTGVRLPLYALREKADELNIKYLVIDGAQALGMIDLTQKDDRLEHSDFYACPGHKFLNGPPSTGVLYIKNAHIRPPEFYPTLSQRMIRYADGESMSYPIAKALQVRGCSNAPGFTAMVRAMDYINDEGGAEYIEKHILSLSKDVKNFILSQAPNCIVSPYLDKKLLSGLTTFYPFKWTKPQIPLKDKESVNWVVDKLLEKNIRVRSIGIPTPGNPNKLSTKTYAIRVSTGYFNTPEDVDSFKFALRDVLNRIN